MPPKAEAAEGKGSTTNEAFLVACIKHAKDKLVIDFDALATEIGMSKGGASNKYRAIIKAIEASKDGDATPKSTPKRKTPAKKAGKAAAAAANGEGEDNDSDASAGSAAPATKKPKRSTAKKPTANTPAKRGIGKKVKAESDDGDEAVVKQEVDGDGDENMQSEKAKGESDDGGDDDEQVDPEDANVDKDAASSREED